MGVRLALGATARAVSWIVLRDSLATILSGLALGVVLAFPALRLTRRLVFGIEPHDPQTLVVSAILLVVVGVLATLVPALRASRTDPIAAIRAE
jgi:ABC-type antimicrobial peptide transport system permease subunit